MSKAGDGGPRWYWCLAHNAVESEEGCRGSDRMGPYASAADAANWRAIAAARNEAWDAEDAG